MIRTLPQPRSADELADALDGQWIWTPDDKAEVIAILRAYHDQHLKATLLTKERDGLIDSKANAQAENYRLATFMASIRAAMDVYDGGDVKGE